MSPVLLWLFFTLDKAIITFNSLFAASVTYAIIAFIVWAVGLGITHETYGAKQEKMDAWKVYFKKVTRPYTILAIVLIPLCLVLKMLLPNTKEAVAIVVVPKVLSYAANSPELKKIPDNLMKMTNGFMEKKIADWAKDIKLDSATVKVDSSKVALDSTIANLTQKLEEARRLKEAAEKVLK